MALQRSSTTTIAAAATTTAATATQVCLLTEHRGTYGVAVRINLKQSLVTCHAEIRMRNIHIF